MSGNAPQALATYLALAKQWAPLLIWGTCAAVVTLATVRWLVTLRPGGRSTEARWASRRDLRKAYLDSINQQYMLTRDKTDVAKADARQENREALYKNAVNAVEKMIQAFTDEAKALSTQTAAILNALHGSVSASASSSLGASYSYGNDTTEAVPPYTGFS